MIDDTEDKKAGVVRVSRVSKLGRKLLGRRLAMMFSCRNGLRRLLWLKVVIAFYLINAGGRGKRTGDWKKAPIFCRVSAALLSSWKADRPRPWGSPPGAARVYVPVRAAAQKAPLNTVFSALFQRIPKSK